VKWIDQVLEVGAQHMPTEISDVAPEEPPAAETKPGEKGVHAH
jgi:hypothetical protein